MIVVSMTMVVFFVIWFVYGTMRASKVVHQKLIRSFLGTTLRYAKPQYSCY